MIQAAFTDGSALIVIIPSKRNNGVYLVRVEPHELELIISHDCPGLQYGKSCSHEQIAVAAYEQWQWWEPKKAVRLETRRIVLQPEWDQLTLPKSSLEAIRELIHDAS